MGFVAIALLIAGGLSALQTATIASALPFSLILMAAIYGLFKALRIDSAKRDSQLLAVTAPTPIQARVPWQQRLQNLLVFPTRKEVRIFITETAKPALETFAKELERNGIEVDVAQKSATQLRLTVSHGEETDFLYEVLSKAHLQPDESLLCEEIDEADDKYFRAEVHLREGGQDYDIMGWSQEQIISDLLAQYEKHLHFLHMLR